MKRVLLISLTILLLAIFPVSAVAAQNQPSTWAVGEVSTVIDLGLVPNYLQGEYNRPITRAEFVSLIMRLPCIRDMAQKKLETGNVVYFSDTENEDVILCAALGIVEGDGKGNFMPNDKLSRQQAAVILYKACSAFAPWVINEDTLNTTLFRGYASYDMPHNWIDGENIRSYARSYINWCYRHNIMAGVGNNAFDADGNYTREQAIITVLRLFYADGQAALNKLQIGPDYYPIYTYYAMQNISGWIDSSLAEHTKEEIGHLADLESKIGFITDNVGVGVSCGHLIDQQGNTLLTDLWGSGGRFRNAKIDYPYVWVMNDNQAQNSDAPVYGVVNIETGEAWAGKMLEDVTGIDYSVKDSGPAKIESAGSGWYRLVAADGTVLSGTYENALTYVGDNLYLGWVSDNPRIYDVIWCDGKNISRVVRKETFRYNNHVFDLGGGVYAAQNTDTQISVFDAFGDTISTVATIDPVILTGSANGLLCVLREKTTQYVYYTQTGKQLPPFF